MTWKRLDNDAYGNDRPLGPVQTHRLAENIGDSTITRTRTGSCAWDGEDTTKTGRPATPLLAGARWRYMMFPWVTSIDSRSANWSIYYRCDTGVTLRWYACIRGGPLYLLDETVVVDSASALTYATWFFDLEADTELFQGGQRPRVVYVLLAVLSEIDIDTTVTYNLSGPPTALVPLAGRTWYDSSTAHSPMDPTPWIIDSVNGTKVTTGSAGRRGPYEVFSRDGDYIYWYPAVPDLNAFNFVEIGSLIIAALGTLEIASVHVEEIFDGGGEAFIGIDQMKVSTSGDQPARGAPLATMAQGENYLAQSRTAIMHWGPSIPYDLHADANRNLRSMHYMSLGLIDRLVFQGVVGDDLEFNNQVEGTRHRVRITPSWLLLANRATGPLDIEITITALRVIPGITQTVATLTTTIQMVPYYQSELDPNTLFAFLGWGRHNTEAPGLITTETSFSNGAPFLLTEWSLMSPYIYDEPFEIYTANTGTLLVSNVLQIEAKFPADPMLDIETEVILLALSHDVRPVDVPPWTDVILDV